MSNKLPQFVSDQIVLPVIAAPMFLVSGVELVVSSCKEGITGTFPTLNARTSDILDTWMEQITNQLTSLKTAEPERRIAPWGVNLIMHQSNKRLEEDLALVMKHKPPIVITSLGNPTAVVKAVHSYGGLVFSDVITLHHAKKAAATGIDGLILVCAGAGGHGGTLNPFSFVQAVQEFWEGIVVVAGGISNGRSILSARALGADLVYMGTHLIAAQESMAKDDYKEMLIESNIEDLVYTDAFSGVHANYLKSSIIRAGIDPDNIEKKSGFDAQSLEGGSKAWRDIWSAGQGVGAIKQVQTVQKMVADLLQEYQNGLDEIRKGEL